jgi:hypothetical protein
MATKNINRDSGGPRVRHLQESVKDVLKRHGFDKWAKNFIVDGKPGPETFKKAGHAASMIGLSDAQVKAIRSGKITPHAEDFINGKERTAAMKKRAKERADAWKKVLHAINHPPTDQDGIAIDPVSGESVPAWVVGKAPGPDGKTKNWLKIIREHGWHGGINSGARTEAHSIELCFQICGAPSCPGLCAGATSNHVIKGKNGPGNWGALDVSEYEVFGRVCHEVGCPLQNDLPADPVHYSPDGH